ncbi:MAG: hypothetical protein JXO50_09255 [Deltaproteobacteria bacterium]|nr:hypothetical protein [Candidatus Anaeroferrophillus wilburensis]
MGWGALMVNDLNTGRIHLIGICGTAMAALACMLQEKGWQVSGSDAGSYPPMSDILNARGLSFVPGYRPEQLDAGLDLVVVGNVAARHNPEVQRAQELGLPCRSLPEVLWSEFLQQATTRVVVAGTHGKTTTASLAAWVLQAAGRQPSFLIGGLVNNFAANYQLGSPSLFVLEGDEYNAAYFDRKAKFHHYRPTHLLLTGLEMDHADIFSGIEAVEEEFRWLIARMPASGVIVAAADCSRLATLLKESPCQVITYGDHEAADCRLLDCRPQGGGSLLTVLGVDRQPFTLPTATIGRHNAANTLAVYLLARNLGISRQQAAAGLESFAGVKRRQEVIQCWRQTIFISDFAHHPTAIAKTLEALRAQYGDHRLVAVFEPRTATSRRNLFQQEFARAFDAADEVLIAPVYRGELLPDDQRLDTVRLAADLAVRGIAAEAAASVEEIFDRLVREAGSPRLVVLMSTGDFAGLYARIQGLEVAVGV